MTQPVPWQVRERKIVLRNYVIPVSIGIYDHEKQAPQRLSISIVIDIEPVQEVIADHIAHVVDYDYLRRGIDELVTSRHFELQETLCNEILHMCFAKSGVLTARVSTAKLDVYPNSDAVGIEVYAERTAQ